MKYRRFMTADRKFLDALLTSEDEFNVTAESHKADHEAGYGVSPLTVVESDTDPWDGVSALVTRAIPRPTSAPTAEDTLLVELEAATTIAGVKAALLKYHGG